MTVGPDPSGAPEAGPPATPEAPEVGTPEHPDFSRDRRMEAAAVARRAARAKVGPPLQWPLTLVICGMVAALVWVAADHFRRGSVLFSAVVLLAFLMRLTLRDRDAGWLVVRSRRVDLIYLGVLSTSLWVFSLIVPPPS